MIRSVTLNRHGTPVVRTRSGRPVPVASIEALERHRSSTMFGPSSRLTLCGAQSKRTGQPGKAPAVRDAKRCRVHGGISAERAHAKPPSERVRRNRLAAQERKWGGRLRQLGAEVVAEFKGSHPEGLQAIREAWAKVPKDVGAPALYVRMQCLCDAQRRIRDGERGAEDWWPLAVGFATYDPSPPS